MKRSHNIICLQVQYLSQTHMDDTSPLLWQTGNCPVSNNISPSSSSLCTIKSNLINIFGFMLNFFSIHLQNSLKLSKRQQDEFQYFFQCQKVECSELPYHNEVNNTYLNKLIMRLFHSLWIYVKWYSILLLHVFLSFLRIRPNVDRKTWWMLFKILWTLMTLTWFSQHDTIVFQNPVYCFLCQSEHRAPSILVSSTLSPM